MGLIQKKSVAVQARMVAVKVVRRGSDSGRYIDRIYRIPWELNMECERKESRLLARAIRKTELPPR